MALPPNDSLLDDHRTKELLRHLGDADRTAGVPYVELPENLRAGDDLFVEWHHANLIQFVRRKHCHVGGGPHRKLVLENGYEVCTRLNEPRWKTVREYLQEVKTESTEDDVRIRVRLHPGAGDAVLSRLRREEAPEATNKSKAIAAIALESLIGEDGRKIMQVAQSHKSADEKMREICRIDTRYLSDAYDSPWWGNLLQVTDAAIRGTPFWKKDRQKAKDALA